MDIERMTVKVPVPSEWSAFFCGIRYVPEKGDEPNWFHRLMHRLILGIRWHKNTP